MMTIDDIFFAAVNGDKNLLTQLLQAGEVDINALIDCGWINGEHIMVPMLFSVLNKMNDTKAFNFEILDILIDYGIDLNMRTMIETDSYKRYVPMLVYAIRTFRSLELMEYLLKKGADPDIVQTETFSDGHEEVYPLLYFALNDWKSCGPLDLLLQYGANPNKRVKAYSTEYACTQHLPLLFYALIICQSEEKCILLLSYGADVRAVVHTGFGPVQEFNFYNYVNRFYKLSVQMLDSAISGKTVKKPLMTGPSPVSQVTGRENRVSDSEGGKAQAPQTKRKEKKTPYGDSPLHEAARALIDFDRYNNWEYYKSQSESKPEHTSRIFLYLAAAAAVFTAVCFIEIGRYACYLLIGVAIPLLIYLILVIKRRIKAEKAKVKAKSILARRKEHINKLNRLADEASDPGMCRWWNCVDKLTTSDLYWKDLLIWMPFDRLKEVRGAIQLNSLCISSDRISGTQLDDLLSKTEKFNVIYKNTDPQSEYDLAQLCFWRIEDGTKVIENEVSLYSEEEIRNSVRDYTNELDSDEAFSNALDGGVYCTDRERYAWDPDMGATDYLVSDWYRQRNIADYEAKLRGQTKTITQVKDRNIYQQHIRPVGIVAFDSDGFVAAVYLYNETKVTEIYDTDHNKLIYNTKRRKESFKISEDRIAVIQMLENFPMDTVDPFSEKPEYLSLYEWAELIYSCDAGDLVCDIMEIVRRKYEFSFQSKAYKIESYVK